MAARVGARGDQHVTRALNALDLAFHDAEIKRIAFVVRRVDGEYRSLNAIQAGSVDSNPELWKWLR